MATAVEISRRDMNEFLVAQGFQEVQVPGTKERVYSKFVDKNSGVCLRVYTSIVGESSRGTGEDAIRTVLVTKVAGQVKIIGGDRRVHRVEGWRANLQNRLDRWAEQLGPACPKCAGATVRKRSGRGPFWGCCKYPVCRTVQPIQTPTKNPPRQPAAGERGGEHEGAAMARRERAEPLQDEWDQRVKDKAAYAAAERDQEAKAYMAEMEAELRAAGIEDGDDEPTGIHIIPANDPPPANW